VIYPTSLYVDGGNFGVVVFRQNSKFDGSAPSRRFQYCRNVVVSWSSVTFVSPHTVSRIVERLPEYRLGPRHQVLPNLVRHDCELLEATLSDNNSAHFSEFLEPSPCFARTR